MSYDIYLRAKKCEHCGRGGEDAHIRYDSPTYNLTPIFDLALTRESFPNPEVAEGHVVLFRAKTDRPRGLRVLDGRKASDTTTQLAQALADLRDPSKRDAFIALEPENKWGDLKGATECIESYLKVALENPDHVWEVR